MDKKTEKLLFAELRLQRKLLLQLKADLAAISVFVVRAGHGKMSEKQAMKTLHETAAQLRAHFSEYDVDMKDILEEP